MLVENGNVTNLSRELPAVFQNTVGASREPFGGDYFLPTFRLYETAIIKANYYFFIYD
jgi:hypothetical protein